MNAYSLFADDYATLLLVINTLSGNECLQFAVIVEI